MRELIYWLLLGLAQCYAGIIFWSVVEAMSENEIIQRRFSIILIQLFAGNIQLILTRTPNQTTTDHILPKTKSGTSLLLCMCRPPAMVTITRPPLLMFMARFFGVDLRGVVR